MARVAPKGARHRDAIFSEALLSALPDGVVTYAADGQCQSANRAAAELLGIPLEKLLSQNFRGIRSWKDSGLLGRAEETMETGVSQQWETLFTSTAGKSLWLHFRLERVDLAGGPTLLVIFADISERKAFEESLQLTQSSVDAAADFVHWLDPDGRILGVSESSCRRYGYSRPEMLGLTIFDLDLGLTPALWRDRWEELKLAKSSTIQAEHRAKDGCLFPVEVTTNYVRHGGAEYDVAFVRDITRRRQTEEVLQLTQLSVDRAADLIHWTDPEGRLLYVSDSMCRRHGYSREEMLGLTVFDLDPLQTSDTWREHWRELKAQGSLTFESLHRTKEGVGFPLELTANYVECNGHEYNFAFGRDITERKQAERMLEDEIFRRRVLVDESRDGIVVLDELGNVREANGQYARMLGYSLEEVYGLHVWDWDAVHNKEELLKILKVVDESGDHFETQHRRKDGSFIDVEISTNAPVIGGEKYIFCICRDITERKRAEEALAVEKERLALLNRAAVEMSQCLTTVEVQRAGMRLACETSKCDGGVMWVFPPAVRSRTMGSEGLTRRGRLQLVKILRTSPVFDRVTADQVSVLLREADILESAASDEIVFTGALIVPVASRGKVLGALCLATRPGHPALTPADVALAEGVAALVGVALENACLYDQARYLAQRDAVTGLLNHRGISAQLEKELARAQRSGGCFAVVMMDLDNFKLFNDTYGHACGDKVLQDVSAALARSVRRGDSIGRYGGDEFVALLPDIDTGGAVRTIERIRETLRQLGYSADGAFSVPVFMSYGVATYPFEGRCVSELLAAADTNLYRSKRQGGNCVTASGGEKEASDAKLGLFTVLDCLVTAVDAKDRYTRKHSDDVSELAVAVASELGLSDETQRSLRIAALLHDVGKIGIPDHLLRKPGRLTEEELEAVKQHVSLGEVITKELPNYVGVLDAVSSHHERYDGRGYPRHLKGKDIPLLGRILAVADAYSAMTTDRPYRKALTLEEARSELQKVSGTQLDPRVVRAFFAVLDHASDSATPPVLSSTSAA